MSIWKKICKKGEWPTPGTQSDKFFFLFFLCASVVSYMMSVLSLFVPHFFCLWSLGRGVLRDFDNSWLYFYIFDNTPRTELAAVPDLLIH